MKKLCILMLGALVIAVFLGKARTGLETSSIFGENITTAESEQNSTNRFLLVEGLLADIYRIEDAAKNLTGSKLDTLYYNNSGVGGLDGGSIAGIRRKWRNLGDLQQYNVVVLANASIYPLGPALISQLREFVRAGGGLLILGGKAAYGGGGIKDSFLAEVLPVEVADTRFDIDQVKGSFLKTEDPLLVGLRWPLELACPYIHRVKLRDNAKVILKVGESPFLVTGTFGKGRVACVLGAPYGITTKDRTIFTDWPDWPLLIRHTLQWLAKK